MADKFRVGGSNTGDYYQIVNGKRQYFDKHGKPMDESVFLANNNAQIAKDGSMRKKQNVAKDGYVKQYYPESKSGRYFTVDKNGKKHFYAADDTAINEAWFYKKEKEWVEAVKAKKSGKTSAKAQAPAQQQEEVGFFEGLCESTKGAFNGAIEFTKGLVTDEKGNFSIKGGLKKAWKATKNVFRDEKGKVSLRGAWHAVKSAGKGVWNAGADMLKGMFANKDGSFSVGSVLKGVGELALFGAAIWFGAPLLAAAAGISAISAGAIIGFTLAAPLIIEGVNQAFEGGNKILDSASETDLAKAGKIAKDGLQTQSKGVTNVVIGETMRRGMKKGASHHVKSYEANLAKTKAIHGKTMPRARALGKTYADGVKSATKPVRHPIETARAIGKAIANQWDRVVVRSTRKGFSERIKNATPEELRNIYEEIAQDEVMSPKSKARAMKEVADKADMQADLGVEGMEDFASSVRDQIKTPKYESLQSEIDGLAQRRKYVRRWKKTNRTEVPEEKINKIETKIDKALEEGKITEAQAEALKARLNQQAESIEAYGELRESIRGTEDAFTLDSSFDEGLAKIKNAKQRDALMRDIKKSNLTREEKMVSLQKLLDTCETEADILDFNFRVRKHNMGLRSTEQRALQRLAYKKLSTINPKKYEAIRGLDKMIAKDAKKLYDRAEKNFKKAQDGVENPPEGFFDRLRGKKEVTDAQATNAEYARDYAKKALDEANNNAKVDDYANSLKKAKDINKFIEEVEGKPETELSAEQKAEIKKLAQEKQKANADKLEKKIEKKKAVDSLEKYKSDIEKAKTEGRISEAQATELNAKIDAKVAELRQAKFDSIKAEIAKGDKFETIESKLDKPEKYSDYKDLTQDQINALKTEVNKTRLAKEIAKSDDMGAMKTKLDQAKAEGKITEEQYRELERAINDREVAPKVEDDAASAEGGVRALTRDEYLDALEQRAQELANEKEQIIKRYEEIEKNPESVSVDEMNDILAQIERINRETEEIRVKLEEAEKAVNDVVADAESSLQGASDEAIRTESVPVREVADVVDCPESIAIEDMPQSRYDFTSVEKPSEVKPSKFHSKKGETLIDEYEFEGKKYTYDKISDRYVSEDGSYLNPFEDEYTITTPSEFGSGENLTRVINKETGNVTYKDGIDSVTRNVNGNIVETTEWNRLDDGRTVTVTRNGNGEIVHSSEVVRTNDSYVNIQKDGSGRVMDYYKNEGETSTIVKDDYSSTHIATETKTENITTFKTDKDGFKQGETIRVVSENGKTTVEVVDANGKTTQYPTDESGAFIRNGKEYQVDKYSDTGFDGPYNLWEPATIKGARACLDKCVDEASLDALANSVKLNNNGAIETRNPWSARNKLLKDIEAKKQQLNSVDMSDVKGAGIHADVTSDIEVDISNLDPKSKSYAKDIEKIRQRVNKLDETGEISNDSAKALNAKLDELKEKSQPTQPTAKPATKPARQYTTDDIRIGKTSAQFGGNATVFNPDNGMLLDIRPNGRGGFDSSTNVTNWSQYGEYVTFMEKGEVRTAIIQDLGETPLGKTMSGVRGGDNITVAVKDKISIAKCKRIKQVMEDIKTEAELETLPQKVNEILNDNSTTTKQIKVGDTTYDYVVDSDGCLVKIGNDEVPFKKDNIPSFKIEGDEYTEYSFENGEIKIIKKDPPKTEPQPATGGTKKPAEMSGDELDAAYEHFETQINGSEYYFKDWNDSNGIVETRIIRNGKVVEPNAEGIYDINGRKYTLKDGGLEEVKEKPIADETPVITADEAAKLNEEFKTRIKDVEDVAEYDAIREDILNSELSDTNKADLLRILEDDKNTRFPQRVVDDEAPVVEDEVIEEAPVEETLEELTGVEKIKNDEFNAVKKSIDDVVDNETYTAARERIEKSSILTNEEKAGMMSMLDEAKGNFKPVTPSPVTPKTFGQKVGSARRATLGTLGFLAGAGLISSRLGSGDDSDEVTEVTETEEVVDNPVEDEVVTPVVTEETDETETTAPVTEDDINGAETEEALDELSQRINDDTTMSQEDKDKLLALINARKEALKSNDGSAQADDEVKSDDDANAQVKDQTIGNDKYTVTKGNDGKVVVKGKDGKVIPVNDDGTVIIDGNKYQVKPDGSIEEVKEQDKGAVEFKKDTYKDRIQGKKDKDGNKPEITHSQVVEFTKAIQNAKTKEDLDNILSDIFTFKMFKGRKQLRTAIRAKRDAIKHSGDEKLVAKKNTKVEKKSARAIERNVDERKSFLGIRLGKKDKTAIDAEMKRLLEEYDKNHKDIEG